MYSCSHLALLLYKPLIASSKSKLMPPIFPALHTSMITLSGRLEVLVSVRASTNKGSKRSVSNSKQTSALELVNEEA